MSIFFYHHASEKKGFKQSAFITVIELNSKWGKHSVTTFLVMKHDLKSHADW